MGRFLFAKVGNYGVFGVFDLENFGGIFGILGISMGIWRKFSNFGVVIYGIFAFFRQFFGLDFLIF